MSVINVFYSHNLGKSVCERDTHTQPEAAVDIL